MYSWLRPLLFRLDPEQAHELTMLSLRLLQRLGPLNPLRQDLPAHPVHVMGLEFRNPLGLAAGLDKNGDCIDGLASLGFGFLEIGTVTPLSQPGNPKPRLFRLVDQQALINRFGFNNLGVEHLAKRVTERRSAIPLGINLGKNRDTPLEAAASDYRLGLRRVYSLADYVTINLSSPNTPGLRQLQSGDHLTDLLRELAEERYALQQEFSRRVPMAVKIAPDLSAEELPLLLENLLKFEVDALIVGNTTLSREGVEGALHAEEAGGLSGQPLLQRSTALVQELSRQLQGALPIIACGGIMSGADAQAKLQAGASLVQIYTGLIYRGPELIREINASLRADTLP